MNKTRADLVETDDMKYYHMRPKPGYTTIATSNHDQ